MVTSSNVIQPENLPPTERATNYTLRVHLQVAQCKNISLTWGNVILLLECRSENTRPTAYGSVRWFSFVWWGKVNSTDSLVKDFSLIHLFFFHICCNLSVAQNILQRQQIFYSEICFTNFLFWNLFLHFLHPACPEASQNFCYCSTI